MKMLLLIGLLVFSLPLWLPSSVGGANSYHFVLTDSMKGTLDPGTFVVVRSSPTYNVGDVVAYREETGGEDFNILHRIVGRTGEGRYILKGDAVPTEEMIEEKAIIGRMVAAIPGLGFLPGAFRQAPFLMGALLLSLFYLISPSQKPGFERVRPELSLFLPAALVLFIAFPFATGGLAAYLGKGGAFLLLAALVGIARLAQVAGVHRHFEPVVEACYILAIAAAATTISLAEVVKSITGLG